MRCRTLAASVGFIGLALGMTTMARAAPDLSGILEHQGPDRPAHWFGAYLLAEGDPEAKIVSTLPRGTRLTIHPDGSNERYFSVTARMRGGKKIQGYIWKEFVRVLAASDVAVTDSTTHDASRPARTDHARAGEVAVSHAAGSTTSATPARRIPSRSSRASKSRRATARRKHPTQADDSGARASGDDDTEPAWEGGLDAALYGSPSDVAASQGVRHASTEGATHLAKERQLKQRIERELDSMPSSGKLSPDAARRADALLASLDALNESDRKISASMAKLEETVQRHDLAIRNLQGHGADGPGDGLTVAGGDTTKLLDEVDILRKAVLRAIMDAAVAKDYARKVDAIEKFILQKDPDGLKTYYEQAERASSWRSKTPAAAGISEIRGDVGAQIVSGAETARTERRLTSLEKRLHAMEARAHRPADDGADTDHTAGASDASDAGANRSSAAQDRDTGEDVAEVKASTPTRRSPPDESEHEAAPTDSSDAFSPLEVEQLMNAKL